MGKYLVTYEEQLPGWDEFDKVRSGDLLVEAESEKHAMMVAEEKLGKYCVAVMAKKVG